MSFSHHSQRKGSVHQLHSLLQIVEQDHPHEKIRLHHVLGCLVYVDLDLICLCTPNNIR